MSNAGRPILSMGRKLKVTAMKSRILFVDDEPRVLQGLQRLLRPLRDSWEMTFKGSGAEALAELDSQPYDVIVSDMRMPGINGAELLEQVKQRHPETIRLILSGQSAEETVLASVGPAHQFLAKPCDPDALIATIRRACALRDLMREPQLQKLLSQVEVLPSPPTLYLEVVKEIKSANPSVRRVAEIVSGDVSMSAKILQLVNSAFFGIARHVSDPQHAVSLLGINTVAALVLSAKVFGQFETQRLNAVGLSGLASHSLAVAAWARAIARAQGAPVQLVDDTFTAALLHDVGKLVLATHAFEAYMKAVDLARKTPMPLWRAERETLGADHARVGAYLLGLWGIPDGIVEALAFHHEPDECLSQSFTSLTGVHVADALQHELQPEGYIGPLPALSATYVERLQLGGTLDAWRALGADATD
jgi:putative nucleotidyltransferase with HDIG domain